MGEIQSQEVGIGSREAKYIRHGGGDRKTIGFYEAALGLRYGELHLDLQSHGGLSVGSLRTCDERIDDAAA